MSPSETDAPPFKSVDWSAQSRSRRPGGRTLLLLGGVAGLAASFVHDYLFAPDEPYPFALVGWDVSQTDWLLLLSLTVTVRYAVVPAVADPKRAGDRLRAVLRRPPGAASAALLAAATVTAAVGPVVVDSLYPVYSHRLQPPVFASTTTDITYSYECVGRVVEGRCHGSWRYPLGTMYTGEDVLEVLVNGVRIALVIGFAAGVMMSVIGTVVGATAGFVGGRLDRVLMSYVDIQQTVPAVLVYLFVTILVPTLGGYRNVAGGGAFALVVVFGLLDWGGIARLVRSETIPRRSAGYVNAARAAGASRLWVLRKHVVPNSRSTVLTAVTRRVPLLILAQVGLSYLRLNRVDSMSLGRLLRVGLAEEPTAGELLWYQKWWVFLPGLVTLVLLVGAFSVFGDVLRDVLDPQTEVE